MGRQRVLHKKKQKPTLKIDHASYERLKAEAGLLNRGYSKIKLGELLSFILDVYFENKDTFSGLTGGAIGTQPEWDAEEIDGRPKKENNGTKQDSLFTATPVKQADNRLLRLKERERIPAEPYN